MPRNGLRGGKNMVFGPKLVRVNSVRPRTAADAGAPDTADVEVSEVSEYHPSHLIGIGRDPLDHQLPLS